MREKRITRKRSRISHGKNKRGNKSRKTKRKTRKRRTLKKRTRKSYRRRQRGGTECDSAQEVIRAAEEALGAKAEEIQIPDRRRANLAEGLLRVLTMSERRNRLGETDPQPIPFRVEPELEAKENGFAEPGSMVAVKDTFGAFSNKWVQNEEGMWLPEEYLVPARKEGWKKLVDRQIKDAKTKRDEAIAACKELEKCHYTKAGFSGKPQCRKVLLFPGGEGAGALAVAERPKDRAWGVLEQEHFPDTAEAVSASTRDFGPAGDPLGHLVGEKDRQRTQMEEEEGGARENLVGLLKRRYPHPPGISEKVWSAQINAAVDDAMYVVPKSKKEELDGMTVTALKDRASDTRVDAAQLEGDKKPDEIKRLILGAALRRPDWGTSDPRMAERAGDYLQKKFGMEATDDEESPAVDEWDKHEVAAWLTKALGLPDIGIAALNARMEGAALKFMDSLDWKEMGASDDEAAQIMAEVTKLLEAADNEESPAAARRPTMKVLVIETALNPPIPGQISAKVMPEGESFLLYVGGSDLIETVKQKITERGGPPPSQTRLIFQSTELNDGRTLADYNVPIASSAARGMLGEPPVMGATEPEPQAEWPEEEGWTEDWMTGAGGEGGDQAVVGDQRTSDSSDGF